MLNELDKLLPIVIDIAHTAGQGTLSFFRSNSLDIRYKSDKTPVTNADVAAHQVVSRGLKKLNNWPLLSEEGDIPNFKTRSKWLRYWLSDPLDGTRGFIQGLDSFSVNIALIENNRPILGVINAPILQTMYYAAKGVGAWCKVDDSAPQSLKVTSRHFDDLRFIAGKYHHLGKIASVLANIPHAELLRLNSSLKFTEMARGSADVYVSFGPIYEWDTAAGQCILELAGGRMVDFNGKSIQYNAIESLRCSPFLAVTNSVHIDRLISLFKQKEGETVEQKN